VAADGVVLITHPQGQDTVLTSVPEDGQPSTRTLQRQSVAAIAADAAGSVGIVAFPDRPAEIRRLSDGEVIRAGAGVVLPQEWVSLPRRMEFPTGDGQRAHVWFYPPTNPDAHPEPGTRPPLIVQAHGGPTSAARPFYSLAVQYWTSRGFALADVDYRGSTGYGRQYRELLNGQWCVVDVEDAAAAARHLAEQGLVDGDRMAIRGGSAGGTTALLATLLGDDFCGAVSYFGVTDLTHLIETTHKFESRYFDTIIGPMPSAAELMSHRSPISHASRAHTPTLVMQGLQDAVVPPSQAEEIVAGLAAKQVPHAYLPFEGEQHGFRIAANQVRALEAELAFYGQVFGLTPADPVELQLEFADRLPGRQA
jgi:dipeptidyl aminopeptidase/acylaminoacyl peptidase